MNVIYFYTTALPFIIINAEIETCTTWLLLKRTAHVYEYRMHSVSPVRMAIIFAKAQYFNVLVKRGQIYMYIEMLYESPIVVGYLNIQNFNLI